MTDDTTATHINDRSIDGRDEVTFLTLCGLELSERDAHSDQTPLIVAPAHATCEKCRQVAVQRWAGGGSTDG